MGRETMARVLMIGIDPNEIDFSDPAIPPGMDAEKVRVGIRRGLEELRAAGHDVQQLFIPADPAQIGVLADQLALQPVDCVAVGGGVRLPPRNLLLFETVLNTISSSEPRPVIALLARPEDAAPAVARVLG